MYYEKKGKIKCTKNSSDMERMTAVEAEKLHNANWRRLKKLLKKNIVIGERLAFDGYIRRYLRESEECGQCEYNTDGDN